MIKLTIAAIVLVELFHAIMMVKGKDFGTRY